MSSGDAGSGLLPAGIQAASVQHPAPAAAHRKASSAPTRTGRVLLPRRSLLPARHRRHRAPDLMLGDPVGNGLQSLRQRIGEGLTLCRAQRPVRHGMAKPLIDLERGLPGRGGELMDRPQQGLYVGRIAQRPPAVPRVRDPAQKPRTPDAAVRALLIPMWVPPAPSARRDTRGRRVRCRCGSSSCRPTRPRAGPEGQLPDPVASPASA